MEDKKPRQDHWEGVYRRTAPGERSWFQMEPRASLQLVRAAGVGPDARILDVGGGTARLVDCLLEAGFRNLGVLDISAAAINQARNRLGEAGSSVQWFIGDVTDMDIPRGWDLWHDRATFHFLVAENQRAAYVNALCASLVPGGHVITATFSPTGPERCSGLPTVRYSAESLGRELGPEFELCQSLEETHVTPGEREQDFLYCLFRRSAAAQGAGKNV